MTTYLALGTPLTQSLWIVQHKDTGRSLNVYGSPPDPWDWSWDRSMKSAWKFETRAAAEQWLFEVYYKRFPDQVATHAQKYGTTLGNWDFVQVPR